MQQLIVIWGGEVFDNNDDYYRFLIEYTVDKDTSKRMSWKDRIIQACSRKMKCFKPHMPCWLNADYKSWKIWFEKYLAFLDNDWLILVWNSLGSTFLIKYLSENRVPVVIDQLHLACPMFNGKCLNPTYAWIRDFDIDESLLDNITSQVSTIHVYHSEDDTCVPYTHSKRLVWILSSATLHTFTDRDHFLQPAFPELLNNIGMYKH